MEKLYNLTSAQNSIWLTEQFSSNTSLNNIGGYVFIQDKVNFNYLEKALKLYVQKNDALNFKIKVVDGEPKQYLSDYEDFKIEIIDLENMEEVVAFNKEIINTPFSFIDSKLYKITMFRLPDGTGGFNATLHHIISDAWNMSILINEVMDCYSLLCNNQKIDLTPFPSYIDSIKSENDYFESDRFKKDSEFWNNMFKDTPELTYIVPDKRENTNSTSNRKIFDLDVDLYDKISEFCKVYNCSIYTFFMAIYSIYIAKINNSHSSIVGTPVLNRGNFKEKHTAGMFISTVPFKIDINSENTFTSFIKEVNATQLGIFRHQKYPYDKLLKQIKKDFNISDNLYDFVLSYQNAKDDKNTCDVNYISNWLFNGHSLDTLQIHFYDMDDNGTPKLYYDYQVDKLKEEDIDNIHNRIMEMSNSVIKNPEILLRDISVVTKKECEKLLGDFNTTPFYLDKNKSLISLFEEQVESFPNKTAVIFEDRELTYNELNEKINILSNVLLDNNIGKNHIIGVMLPRSFETLIAIWSILKSGNGYMLIDPSLPTERIKYMLENSNASLLITNSDFNIDFSNKLLLDSSQILSSKVEKNINFANYSNKNINIYNDNDDTFCIIYTSGSTGTPKGVELKRIGIINMLYSYKHFLYTDTCNTFLSTSTVAFDMFIVENFVSLLSGKTVVLANEEQQKVPIFMSKLIEKYQVDFILSTPSKISLLLLNDTTKSCLKNVKVIQLGGEVFKEHLYNELRAYTNAKIFNGYGPSECTACCSNKEITSGADINIGKPFLNTNIYILNSDLNLLPIGYSGEICVAGLGVGKGYIHNADLTNKSFIRNPFNDNYIYKTGDIGKYSYNGDLIYQGRRDTQIKLRGLRIELDEITNKIVSINGITDAVSVIKKVNHVDCICSYVVSKNTLITEDTIKKDLYNELPQYMIPSHIIFLDFLPITLNGKIDTKKLPNISLSNIKYIAPTTKTEIILSKLWSKILNINPISINMNFFDLGGDSLCSIKLISEIYSTLNVKISIKDIFDNPTIQDLSKYIDTIVTTKKENSLIPKSKLMAYYPLSSAQKRIYYTIKMNPTSINYNTSGGLVFNQLPNVNKLEECFNKLIKRHSSLRTYFVVEKDEVVQKISDTIYFKLSVIDANGKTPNEIFNEFVKPFDLEIAPLFRATIYKFSDNEFILFIDMNHIICDGESFSIFINELCKLYNDNTLPDHTLDYVDYAVWENNAIKENKYLKSEQYWMSQFQDEIPALNMPTTYMRPSIQSFEGEKIYKSIPNANKIFDLCKKLNTTPYIFLLSVYYILLYKYTNQNDIIVGSPIVGRDNVSTSNMIGMFVNTIALKAHINCSDSFKTFLTYTTSNCFNTFEHQTYPFDELLKKLNIPRDTSRNPLFDTMFIYQNNGNPRVCLNNLETHYYIPDNHTSKFDFSLEVTPENDNLNLCLEYCTKLFDRPFMERFLEHYINALQSIMKDINIHISNINILSQDELQIVLEEFNDTKLDYPSEKTIIEQLEEQVKLNPNNIALIYQNQKLTYMDLYQHVSKLACYLQYNGVQKGDIVCTLLPRSSELIISLLAIMKCGAIYLPISITFPDDRINYIVQNSQSKLIICNSSIKTINSISNILIDKIDYINFNKYILKDMVLSPNDIIYTIYTSGSTGVPKGVEITNRNLNNFIHAFKGLFDNSVDKSDICLSTTSIAFDVSIWEIFFTLLNGATLYLYEKESIEDIFDYCNKLINNHITMAYIPPNILEETYSILSESSSRVNLDKVLVGVEPIKTNIIKKYFNLNPNMKIINGYGPTETTICTTAFKIENSVNSNYNIVPIGKPLSNMKAYVLNDTQQPLPIGIPGELYVSGDNVGYGYLNNSNLTQEKYLPCPFEKNAMMYKTGDIVKWLPDGNLMFVGRNDKQIKIKGHRIEINEITNVISEYPTIIKSVVVIREENDNKYLVAYFTATNKVVINDLRSFLAQKLPFYSIPNFFVQLDKFILTSNGKIDFNYLRDLKLETTTIYEAPRNDFERKLSDLWREFLKVPKVGINDNFFDLGGDSLIAIKLQIEAFKLGIDISYSDIFAYPTIKQLSSKSNTHKTNIDICDFDYTGINNLISKNKLPVLGDLQKSDVNNIMLTGVTGFVGIHILDKLLSNTNCTVFCLVRNKDNIDYISRLKKTLHFYFGEKYDTLIGNRIQIVEGDVTRERFGLSESNYQTVGNKVSCLINSAAIVKHYGKSNTFAQTNINGVKNVIEFCIHFNIKLYHISTLSVSGNVFAEDSFSAANSSNKVVFKENNLFVGQDLSNIYIYTKFMAERIILDNIINKNLNATIIRLGNITSRFSDGKFQINVTENAFLNRLLSFIQLKCIPDYLLNGYTEFTPVDCCADAISKIAQCNLDYTIIHLFNNNHISISDIINILNGYGLSVKSVDNNTFLNTVNHALQVDKNILSGIINDFDSEKKLIYSSNVTLNNDLSNQILEKLSFAWPKIDKEYIYKYLDYLKNIGYINTNKMED